MKRLRRLTVPRMGHLQSRQAVIANACPCAGTGTFVYFPDPFLSPYFGTFRTMKKHLMPVPVFNVFNTALIILAILVAFPANAGDADAGRDLYQFGTLASGEPVLAQGFADTEIAGETAACVQCHRRSGFGSYEGGFYVPPVTQPYLFGGRQISRDDRFRALFMQAQTAEFRHQVRRIRDRPAYTLELLGKVLRDGVDPNGRTLEHLMPRYSLSDTDLNNLYAYLQTLSAEVSPGVSEPYVDLATIVHEDVDPARVEAMIGTMESFVDWFNTRTRGDLRLAGHSVYGSSLYTKYARLYRLHVWELSGPPETWRAQLEEYLREQPVFAMIGGQVDGSWAGISRFAEQNQIPTLFPITDLPGELGPLGGYTLYFNRGWYLEADLMLNWLRQEDTMDVWQVVDQGSHGDEVAAYLQQQAGELDSRFSIQSFDATRMPDMRQCNEPSRGDNTALVVWTRDPDVESIEAWRRCAGAGVIVLPAIVSSHSGLRTLEREAELRFSYPFALQNEFYPERHRARAWMNTRGLDYDAVDVQFKAYYAMSMFRDSFRHLLDHYHRDYLVEVFEHQIQGSPNPGLFPEMELSPRQRYTSRSGYIVALAPEHRGGLEPVTDRVVP